MKALHVTATIALLLAGGCAAPKPAVNAVSNESRSDSLSMTIDSESSATLHGVTLEPADTTRPTVRIERIEIERRSHSEANASSGETTAGSVNSVPAAPTPSPMRGVWILALAAVAVILLRR